MNTNKIKQGKSYPMGTCVESAHVLKIENNIVTYEDYFGGPEHTMNIELFAQWVEFFAECQLAYWKNATKGKQLDERTIMDNDKFYKELENLLS